MHRPCTCLFRVQLGTHHGTSGSYFIKWCLLLHKRWYSMSATPSIHFTAHRSLMLFRCVSHGVEGSAGDSNGG